jgi:thiamine biosynthesis protein ThiS
MQLIINGQTRELETLRQGSTVAELVATLAMQADRVALEQNGEIVPRTQWAATPIAEGDRMEIVHFVGGGSGASAAGGYPA